MFELLPLLILALAVYRLTRLIVEDRLLEPAREWVWKRRGPDTMVGYLLTCYWCTSIWVSAAVVGLYLLVPPVMLVVCLVLALSAVAGLIDTKLN